jgi:hypothetical protein
VFHIGHKEFRNLLIRDISRSVIRKSAQLSTSALVSCERIQARHENVVKVVNFIRKGVE